MTAAGHNPWRGLTGVEADQHVKLTAAPEAIPAPTGEMTITSNIAGVMINVDGEPSAFAPSVLTHVSVGLHQVAMETPGRLPWSGKVEVEQDKRIWLTVNLEEPPTSDRGGAGGAPPQDRTADPVVFTTETRRHRD